MIKLLFVLLLTIFLSKCSDGFDYCYAEDKNPYLFFGSKTSYDLVRGNDIEDLLYPTNCKPVYTWALIRHGVRYSDKIHVRRLKDLQNGIVNNHENGRGSMCLNDIRNIKKWEYEASGRTQDELTSQGYAELIQLAKRLEKNFENLDSNAGYKLEFISSDKQRTKNSAKTLASVFLNNPDNVESYVTINDTFLKLSEEWQTKVADNKSLFTEELKLLQSEYFQDFSKNLSSRLGYREILSLKSIKEMYRVCAFENAWIPKSKPAFCAVFLLSYLEIMEYLNDLHDYYEIGYGSPFNTEVQSALFGDLMSKIDQASESDQLRGASFYFTHSSVISQMIVELGLNRDSEPLRNDTKIKQKMVKWSTSKICPFMANVIAAVYKCSSTKTHDYNYTKIALFHNEHIIKYPKCSENGLCPVEFFRERYTENSISHRIENSAGNMVFQYPVLMLLWLLFTNSFYFHQLPQIF